MITAEVQEAVVKETGLRNKCVALISIKLNAAK
jgi:hypothetical protein